MKEPHVTISDLIKHPDQKVNTVTNHLFKCLPGYNSDDTHMEQKLIICTNEREYSWAGNSVYHNSFWKKCNGLCSTLQFQPHNQIDCWKLHYWGQWCKPLQNLWINICVCFLYSLLKKSPENQCELDQSLECDNLLHLEQQVWNHFLAYNNSSTAQWILQAFCNYFCWWSKASII